MLRARAGFVRGYEKSFAKLFVLVRLDTQMHGSLPADDLVITSDDPEDPQLAIPIIGQVLGAPAR